MTERRVLDPKSGALFDRKFYALSKDGRFDSASTYEGSNFSVAYSRGARLVPMPFKFPRSERPEMPAVRCRRA